MADIDRCDMLIAMVNVKAIGVGVEAGYAKAKGMPVVFVRQKNAEHSTTVSGISDAQIIYGDIGELKEELREIVARCI